MSGWNSNGPLHADRPHFDVGRVFRLVEEGGSSYVARGVPLRDDDFGRISIIVI